MRLSSKLGNRFKTEFVSRILATASGALLVVILARILDPNGYGLLFLSISIFSIVRVFSKLGIAKSAARYISEYRETDRSQIPHILKKSFIFNTITVGIVAGIFTVGHRYIAIELGEPDLIPLLSVGVLYIIFGTLTTYARIIAQGFEDIRLSATLHAIDRVARFVFAVGFVLAGFSAVGALVGFIIGSVLASSIGVSVLYRRYYLPIQASTTMESGLSRRIIKYNVPLTVTNLSGKVDKQVDTLLVGFFLNPVAVSFYVLGKQLVGFVQMPAGALGFSISPTFGTQKAADEHQKAATMFEYSLVYTLLLYIPAAIGIFLVADPAVGLIFGESYTGSVPVVQILSIYTVFAAITNITDSPLDYLGRARARAIVKGIASMSNIALNILLIPRIGVVGAAIATVITHSFYISFKMYLISVELPLDWRQLRSDIAIIGAISGGMGLVVWYFSQYITDFITLSLTIALGVLVWGGLTVITGIIDYGKIFKSIKSSS